MPFIPLFRQQAVLFAIGIVAKFSPLFSRAKEQTHLAVRVTRTNLNFFGVHVFQFKYPLFVVSRKDDFVSGMKIMFSLLNLFICVGIITALP